MGICDIRAQAENGRARDAVCGHGAV